jgi:chorismate mutase/prephenate dehydratase
MVVTSHRPGALYRIMSKFNAMGLNLLKIESRPLPDRDFEFSFYFDFEASVYSKDFGNMLSELENSVEDFRYFGTYSELV